MYVTLLVLYICNVIQKYDQVIRKQINYSYFLLNIEILDLYVYFKYLFIFTNVAIMVQLILAALYLKLVIQNVKHKSSDHKP